MAKNDLLERRIDALRAALRDATEFAPVVDLFERSLADHRPFREASIQARDTLVEQSIAEGVCAITKRADPVVLLLFRVPAHAMWHGFTVSNGNVGLFFGFDGTRQLCLCVPEGGHSHYLRITWSTAPLRTVPSPRGTA